MRILVITLPPWRDDKGDGNVLTNLFSDFDAEFAGIYCMNGIPSNMICRRYYQMTDQMAISNILHHSPMGKTLTEEELRPVSYSEQKKNENRAFYSFFWKHKWELFYIIREAVWSLSGWKNEQLRSFILDFSPDIIYAPLYANCFTSKLLRYVQKISGAPVISPVYDDIYSLDQIHFDPLYWIHRFAIRHQLRKTLPVISLLNTFAPKQKEYCEHYFAKRTVIIPKSGVPAELRTGTGSPIRIIYAGGIYLNRYKTLVQVVKAIRAIDPSGNTFRLDIFTDNDLYDNSAKKLLDDRNCSFLHSAVPYSELKQAYAKSDIALHAESFDAISKKTVHMSFSTKIVDCLESGCAVLAIADAEQAGFSYLKKEDAAICISNPSEILPVLRNISDHPEILDEMRRKAKACLAKNHSKSRINELLHTEFEEVILQSGKRSSSSSNAGKQT